MALREVCSQWRQHSQLLADSDFAVVEPIMAARSVTQHTLAFKAGDLESGRYIGSVLTDHLMELCRLARTAGNTQVGCVLGRVFAFPPGVPRTLEAGSSLGGTKMFDVF